MDRYVLGLLMRGRCGVQGWVQAPWLRKSHGISDLGQRALGGMPVPWIFLSGRLLVFLFLFPFLYWLSFHAFNRSCFA